MKKELTIEDIDLLNEILKMRIVTKEDVHKMQVFITKFIDKKAHICSHCNAQIRFAHQRIQNWAMKNKDMIEKVAKEHKEDCIVCGNPIEDKRRKDYCSSKCKKNGK